MLPEHTATPTITRTVTLGAPQDPYRRIVRRSPRFQRGSPSNLPEAASVRVRTPTPETHHPPAAAPPVVPPPWVASIEKVGASLEGLFSKFASFGAVLQQQQAAAPVAHGAMPVTSPVAVSPPDERTPVPQPPEGSSSRDVDPDVPSSRQNIRLTREADMPLDDEPEDSHSPPRAAAVDDPDRDESSSSPHARKKRRVDEEDDSEVIVTLREAKYWVYTVLGQQACPLPPVRRQSLAPILMHRTPDEEPDYSALPLSAFTLESLVRHNRALQGLDSELADAEVDCGKRRLAQIITDTDTISKGVSMTRHKCRRLKMEAYYKVHSTEFLIARCAPVDQEMAALVKNTPPPVCTLHHWEEVEKIGRGQVAVISLLEFFVAATRHHLEAARLSQDARARALKEKCPLPTEVPVNFPMLGRLMESMAEAIRHSADMAVKQVTNGVLVRWVSYLAKSGLCERVRRPLKALPIEARRLFADRMVEAIDLDREEKKAQSGRAQGTQQAKKQYNKPASAPARQQSTPSDSGQGRNGGSNRNQPGKGKPSRGRFPKGKAGKPPA